MKILINLSDSVYDAIKNKYTLVNPKEGTLIKTLWDAVENGTPLPKGYGRLGDLDALREEVYSWGMNDYEPLDFIEEIDDTPTIIEADRSEEE